MTLTRRSFMLGAVSVMAPCVTFDASGGDDTDAMQAAMSEAVRAGRPLVLDPVTYTVHRLNVPNGLVMIGAGNPGGYGVPTGPHTRIALIAGTNDHMIYGAPGVANVRLSGIHFDGNKNNNRLGDVINIADVRVPEEAQWHIRDCFIEAGASQGIYVGNGRRAVQISDSTVNYNGSSGIRLNGSDSHLDRCIIGSNGVTGVGIGGTVASVARCDIYNNKTGITVYSSLTKVNIIENRIDKHVWQGVLISAGCNDVRVALNILHGNAKDIVDLSGSATVVTTDNIHSTE